MYCTVCRKVYLMLSVCVLDHTTNDRGRMQNDRLTLNFTRTFISYLRKVRQMTKSIYPYPLHSLPISTPYLMPLNTISSPYTWSITVLG
jgi:hypothetical protein